MRLQAEAELLCASNSNAAQLAAAVSPSRFKDFLAGRRRRRTHGDRQHGCQTQSDNH
jgi:hypothetical protein